MKLTSARVSAEARESREQSGIAVDAVELTKIYPGNHTAAVVGLNLRVPVGEFVGLLGPNGAGKSTTIGMLTTLITPSGGSARVAGADVTRDPVRVRRAIGVTSQHNTLDTELTLCENLEFRGRFCGMTARAARRRAEELVGVFRLGDRAGAFAAQLSGGQVQRTMIARA